MGWTAEEGHGEATLERPKKRAEGRWTEKVSETRVECYLKRNWTLQNIGMAKYVIRRVCSEDGNGGAIR